ncbi:MAG: hypothetical protein VX613_02595 [Candidatus Thermoplasmatota archaeon]|nr:hypothetical protein [Candidatus Thermoplasmatota archaeon]MEE3134473.1 hypothetical protein [Candidatus Thermoplasmatota archaeon]
MGFKARARKSKSKDENGKKDEKSNKPENEVPCGIKSCDNFADKHLGGRSIGRNKVLEVWNKSDFDEIKGRVRMCKKCYRILKKETKDSKEWV